MSGASPGKFSVVSSTFRAAGAPLDPRQCEALEAFLELLLEWNRRINLTGLREPDAIAETHFLDSSLVARGLRAGESIVDVGSGAGFPGLVVAILRRDVGVTLVEPVAKKVAFLRTAIETTGAANAEVRRARHTDLADGQWDRAVSRATMTPAAWLGAGRRLVRRGGAVAVMVAHEGKLPEAPEGMRREEAHGIVLPRSRAPRLVAWYARE